MTPSLLTDSLSAPWLIGAAVLALAGAVGLWSWRFFRARTLQPAPLAGARHAPEAFALIAAVGLAAAGQASFDRGEPGRGLGIALMVAAFPATWLWAYLGNRAAGRIPAIASPPEFSPRPLAGVMESVLGQPWRTFLGTLAVLAIVASSALANDASNNLRAGLLWLAAVGLFVVACGPASWRPDLARWRESLRRQWLELFLAASLLAAGSFACLYRLDRFPVGVEQDEGQFGREARWALAGEPYQLFGIASLFDHTAVFSYLQAGSMTLFGQNIVGLRALSGVMGSLSLLFVYLLARRMFGARLALLAGALFAFAPYHLLFSRLGIHDMVVMQLFIPAVVYFLYRGLHSQRTLDYALAGVFFGTGLWLDYNNKIMILIPIVVALLAYLIATRKNYWRSEYLRIGIFLAGAVLALLPLWTTLAGIDKLWADPSRGRFLLGDPHWIAAQERYGTSNPMVVMARQVEYTVFGLNYYQDVSFLVAAGPRPMLDSLTAVFFFMGLAYCLWRWREPQYGFLLLIVLVGLQASIWTNNPPQAHRMTPLLMPAYVMAAIGMAAVGRRWAEMLRWDRRIYLGTLAALVVGSISYNSISIFLTPASYPRSWLEASETGKAIEAWSRDYDIYYAGLPWYYADSHGAILFNSYDRSLAAIDVEDVQSIVPLREAAARDVAFILSSGHLEALEYLRGVYPNGSLVEWMDDFRREVYLAAYLVTQDEVNSAADPNQDAGTH